jgi:predicted RND superfamily exporter protein
LERYRRPEETEALKQDILSNRFARDIVVSSDMTAAAITGTINTDVSEYATLTRIDSIIATQEGDAKIMTCGLPYIRQFISKDVNHDAMILIPIALLIMLTVLKLSLVDWRSVFTPFTVVILSTVITWDDTTARMEADYYVSCSHHSDLGNNN